VSLFLQTSVPRHIAAGRKSDTEPAFPRLSGYVSNYRRN